MKKLICGILMLGTIAGVYGQKVMSLEECRLLALENNKKLKMADEQINAAKAKKEEAFTKYLPALDAMGTYMRNQKEINLLSEDAHLPVGTIGQDGKWTLGKDQIMIGADGKPVMNNGQYVPKDYALLPKEAMTVDDRNMALLQVGLTQPIYMGGKIRAYNQLAGLSEKLAESGREQELQNIIQETDEAYWQIVSLVNRQKLAVKFVETLQKFEHDIEVMYRTGVSTKADMLSVKVKLNQAEMALLRVEDGLSLARMNLNQICGLAVDSVYTLQEELLNVLPQAEPKWLNIEQVYDNRPEISSLTLATDIYRKKEKIARSAYLPTVAFMANYFAITPSFFDGISTGFDGMWSVGIGVKAPIFHWGASRKTVRSARAETSLMNFKLQEAREKIELQVSQARLKIKEAARKYDPENVNLLYYLGRSCAKTSWKKQGVEYLEQAINLSIPKDSSMVRLYIGMTDCYKMAQMYKEQLASIKERYQKYDRQNHKLLYDMAHLSFFALKDRKSTERYLEAFLKTRPKDEKAEQAKLNEKGELVLGITNYYNAADNWLKDLKSKQKIEDFFQNGNPETTKKE